MYRDSATSYAKMAELMEVPFGAWTQVSPVKHVLDGGTHWRHLANMIDLSVCDGDAAFL